MPPPTINIDAAKEMYEKLTQALVGRSRCAGCCDMVIASLSIGCGFDQMRNWLSAGRGAKPRQDVGAADMRGLAEAGVRHAFDENFRGRSHFLPHHARVVMVGGDLGQRCFCLAEVVEAISRGLRRG